jgi:hypothetical protein
MAAVVEGRMSELERVARVLLRQDPIAGDLSWEELDAADRDEFLRQAGEILAAIDEARAEHVMRDLVAGIHITKDGKRIALEDFYIPAPPRAGQ